MVPPPRRQSQKTREILDAIQKLHPEEAASYLLQRNGGDPRAAEVDAWELYDMAAGGTWGSRGKNIGDGARNALEIIKALLEHLEDPPVKRTPVRHPAYAMRYGGALPQGGAKNLLSSLAKAAGVK